MSNPNEFVNDFFKAMRSHSKNYRIHAKLKNGDIGITPPYTLLSIDDLIKEIEATGATIIKIEELNS